MRAATIEHVRHGRAVRALHSLRPLNEQAAEALRAVHVLPGMRLDDAELLDACTALRQAGHVLRHTVSERA